MTRKLVRLALSAAGVGLAALSLTVCGGGGDSDAGELKRLRGEAESTFNKSDEEVVVMIEAALEIARRNSGEALGDEALAFAEDVFLAHSWSDVASDRYVDRTPEPPGVKEPKDFDDVRRLVGFLESVPAPYVATRVLERAHTVFDDHIDHYLFRLGEALEARQTWVADLQAAGATSQSFNTEVSGAWKQYGLEIAYYRTLAERAGEPDVFLKGCDLVAAALLVADFEPAALSRKYENNTLTSTYTPEALQAGKANAEALAAALSAARLAFPAE